MITRIYSGELRKEIIPQEAKRVRFLQKLLRQIESLKDRQDNGETLNEAQLTKISRMDAVVAEIEEILDVNLDSSSDEEEEEEEEDHDKVPPTKR